MDFHLSVWLQKRESERENDHVGMRSLKFCFISQKIFPLRLVFNRKLNGESHDNQSNWVIFANATFYAVFK